MPGIEYPEQEEEQHVKQVSLGVDTKTVAVIGEVSQANLLNNASFRLALPSRVRDTPQASSL